MGDQILHEKTDRPHCPDGARLIPLTRGYFAIIDGADFEAVSRFRWHAHGGTKSLREVYAATTKWIGNGRSRRFQLHRWLLNAGAGELVDHANGNTLDNRRCNLRLCSPSENSFNRRKRPGTAAPYKGVWRKPDGFYAKIGFNYRTIHLGIFSTAEEAALAYDRAARRLHGEFACLNFSENSALAGAPHRANKIDSLATGNRLPAASSICRAAAEPGRGGIVSQKEECACGFHVPNLTDMGMQRNAQEGYEDA